VKKPPSATPQGEPLPWSPPSLIQRRLTLLVLPPCSRASLHSPSTTATPPSKLASATSPVLHRLSESHHHRPCPAGRPRPSGALLTISPHLVVVFDARSCATAPVPSAVTTRWACASRAAGLGHQAALDDGLGRRCKALGQIRPITIHSFFQILNSISNLKF
jgi:hypothetical protein